MRICSPLWALCHPSWERGQGRLLTCVGGPVGERQVGSRSPRPGAKVLLALAAVLPRGVVLTLALKAALFEGAQVSVEVAFTPGRGTQEKSCQVLLQLLLAPGQCCPVCENVEVVLGRFNPFLFLL